MLYCTVWKKNKESEGILISLRKRFSKGKTLRQGHLGPFFVMQPYGGEVLGQGRSWACPGKTQRGESRAVSKNPT